MDAVTLLDGLSATIAANVVLGSAAALYVGVGSALTISGAVSSSGSLSKTGSGTAKLSGDVTGLTGATTVENGELLLGLLDSVFEGSDELTFNNKLQSALSITDPGNTGGTFALNVDDDLQDGTLSISATGVVSWQPDAGCGAGAYAMTSTYTYAGGSQTKALAVAVQHIDLPPVFFRYAYSGGPTDNYAQVGTQSADYIASDLRYWAVDAEDQTLTYSFDAASTNPPANCHLDSNGYFCCTFVPADANKVFDFYLRATDSAGQYDRMRIVIPVHGSTGPTPIRLQTGSYYASVQENVGGYLPLPPLDWSVFMYPSVRKPIIDTAPTHGTLTVTSLGLYYVPDPGFRGLDKFTCHEQAYNDETQDEYWTVSNVATEYIQVGSTVDLTPADKYGEEVSVHAGEPLWQLSYVHPVVDKAVLGVGETSTVTLTLQNPWGDGVPAAGEWSLDFDRSVVRVYGSAGGEIMPNAPNAWRYGTTFLENGLSGEKTIALTVVAVAAGNGTITAHWDVWDKVNSSLTNPPTFCFQWATEVKYAVLAIDLNIDSDNNDGYGSSDDSVQEEYLENNSYGLGKVIFPNWGDFDHDGVLNCWDGFWVGTAYLGQDTA